MFMARSTIESANWPDLRLGGVFERSIRLLAGLLLGHRS